MIINDYAVKQEHAKQRKLVENHSVLQSSKNEIKTLDAFILKIWSIEK